ncbi:MAG: hypothetical protein LKF49_06295 [Bifidobacterium tibiigranuli]|jgi:hypothetical protein|uniref:hypothetical protein n=1 Tax=Bifidobacterium tibiigranuli TaxID=2172043 RepID=UPI0023530F02|nr:hypothetical protein [Bifidobacterium tibiigranuli]MCH3973808.1 hypothetical protein [Bifidobacterium tibiigranuli]MCH4189412.1 hypothetical protein [Bifidobacterium tibiigranuli]MCH4203803.1 hypothetical protein [Bifidobacterium tibiigranuli]MCH4274355.1 hypothetical protein [Bifidobacterium tibiigranuli]MCI1791422.1 hypothetical protein [Bifidobacterium tibiigranuli]
MMIQALKKAPDAGTFEADNSESSYRVDSPSMVHHRYRMARLARKGEIWRPARLDDVLTERGEFVGNGTFDWEPLDWSRLKGRK